MFNVISLVQSSCTCKMVHQMQLLMAVRCSVEHIAYNMQDRALLLQHVCLSASYLGATSPTDMSVMIHSCIRSIAVHT